MAGLLLVLMPIAPALRAQSALDGFDPNANSTIRAVVLQPDGKILIGGDFTTLAPNGGAAVTRNRIARLNPDGTLDTAFNPNANDDVYAIAVQTDGKIVIGGRFTMVGAQTRNHLARLDATTGAPDSFNPNANDLVRCITLQADGKILAGGVFTSAGGQVRNRIVRLDPASGLADTWDANASSSVFSIAIAPGGRIVAAGQFTVIGGQPRNFIARLDAAVGNADTWNPSANGAVTALAVQPDGDVLAGGVFITIGGQSRNRIARLDGGTGLADAWNPDADVTVFSIAVQPDGKVLVGGEFTNIGGQLRLRIARLDRSTGAADTFSPNANSAVLAIALQDDGKVLVGGEFGLAGAIGGVTRNRIARLEPGGNVEKTFDPGIIDFTVHPAVVQLDGKIVIGGSFTSVQGVTRNRLARFNVDGTLDSTFNPNANSVVSALALQADGKILVGGSFSTIGGQMRSFLARLDPATGLADSFNPAPGSSVSSIVVQADGKILIGGNFTTVGGQARGHMARLDVNGVPDSFNPLADDSVTTIAVQPDGKIVVGGTFTFIGSQPRNRIARLSASTSAADTFNPNADQRVRTILVQPDGKILVGGFFTNIGGQARNRMARLTATTGAADSFNPNVQGGIQTQLHSMALQSDGKIVIGGDFTTIGATPVTRNYVARIDPATGLADSFHPNVSGSLGDKVESVALTGDGKVLIAGSFSAVGGQSRANFARLSNDTAALQDLTVTRTAISWARDGASPQLWRVGFESSTDNVNYTPLGAGTLSGNTWTLSGLNLPTGQNLFIRARGQHQGGYQTNSGSMIELVRNVYLGGALQLTAAVSRKTHGVAGDFDINLLNANFGPECRSSGGNHTLVFTFTNDVVSGNVTTTSGTGGISGSPIFEGNTITVNLVGVSDVQKLTLSLSNVTDVFAQVLPTTAVSVNMLVGDINSSKVVNATDIGAVKAQSGAPVTAANFRADVAVSGTISASDIGLVKSRSGQSVP